MNNLKNQNTNIEQTSSDGGETQQTTIESYEQTASQYELKGLAPQPGRGTEPCPEGQHRDEDGRCVDNE